MALHPDQFDQLMTAIASLDRKLDVALHGPEGKPEKGLLVRLDRLEQSEARRSWVLRALAGTSLGLILERAHDYFFPAIQK